MSRNAIPASRSARASARSARSAWPRSSAWKRQTSSTDTDESTTALIPNPMSARLPLEIAVTTAAVLRLGRFKGVPSPAIACPLPIPNHHPQLLVDGGAVVDPPPERLVQYALMGAIFAERVMGVADPRVALLSIGEEKGKGDARIQRATELLDAANKVRAAGFTKTDAYSPFPIHGLAEALGFLRFSKI